MKSPIVEVLQPLTPLLKPTLCLPSPSPTSHLTADVIYGWSLFDIHSRQSLSQPSRLFTKLSRSHRPLRTISESLHIPPLTIPQWKGVENGVNEDGSHSSREFKAAKLNEIIHQFRVEHAPRNMEAAVSDFAGSPSTRIPSQIRFRHADILMNILPCRDRINHTNRT